MKHTAVIAAAALCGGLVSAQPVVRMGAIGDSLSDEYLEQNYGAYAMSWTEILNDLRSIDFGPTAADAGVGNWGEPRREGFQDNWARFGDTINVDDSDSTSALTRGQHTGLADGIVNRGVSHAVIYIGGNDLSPFHGPYASVYNGNWTMQQIEDYVDDRIDGLETILDTVDTGGVKILLANAFDFGDMPRVERDFPDDSGRALASALYDRFDVRVREVAEQRGLPLADMLSLNRAIFGTAGAETSSLVVGGISFDVNNGSGNRRTDMFVNDDVHPRTVLQGIWANLFITGLNAAYNTGITPLTETEILSVNLQSPTGPDALESQIGSLDTYIILPTTPPTACLADVNNDGVATPADFTSWVAAFNSQGPKCDQNGDGLCNPQDFTAWVMNYNMGC
ncbi:MAG: GC-type dockerin domain-anchored protein [Planctomycetota bacterium]